MSAPDHLFAADDGALYDTREAGWHKAPPLRATYCRTFAAISNTAELRATLRAGSYAWPGGYPLYFITDSGEALSFKSVRANLRDALGAFTYPERFEREWRVVACAINYEDSDLYCDHSGERIAPAYDSEDEESV